MKFDTEGTYTLTYTATDSCGNSTSENRTVVVASPRTVLYTDGTLIINEQPEDRAANVALHGAATNTYAPFDPNGATRNERYDFQNGGNRPWGDSRLNIRAVEIGEVISPTSLAYWFFYCENCTEIDLTNLDVSNITSIEQMCNGCTSLTVFTPPNSNASRLTNARQAFMNCTSLAALDLSWINSSLTNNISYLLTNCNSLQTLDISNISSSNVSNAEGMLNNCEALTTIYASPSFALAQGASSGNMFGHMSSALKGGAGTTWNSSNPTDGTYARIDNPPDAPGYFTLKPSA